LLNKKTLFFRFINYFSAAKLLDAVETAGRVETNLKDSIGSLQILERWNRQTRNVKSGLGTLREIYYRPGST
jgi:hypothetical protein